MALPARLRGWWSCSLSRRLLVSRIATLVLFLSLLGLLSFRTARTAVRDEVYRHNAQLTTLVANSISLHFDNIVSTAELFGRQLVGSSASPALQARTMLNLRRSSPQDYRALYLFDSGGRLLLHLTESAQELAAIGNEGELVDRPPIPVREEVRDTLAGATGQDLYVSAAKILTPDLVPVLVLGLPVPAEKDQDSLVAVLELDLRSIWRRIDEINIGKSSRIYVVSEQGIIIAHTDRTYIGEPLAVELALVLRGYEGQSEYRDPRSGHLMLASYSPVGRMPPWGVVVEQEGSDAFAAVNRIGHITLALVTGAVLIASLLTSLFARSVTGPLRRLAETAQRIADSGDLSQSVTVAGRDEVGRLAGAFNRMVDSLRVANAELKRYTHRLEEMVAERTRELEQTQEQLLRQERLAALGQLAGGVGHELRNPLGVISNAVYFLRMYLKDQDPTTQEYLGILSAEVGNAARIIADLLDFSRLKPQDKGPVDVAELIDQVLERRPPPGEIEVAKEIDPGLPELLVDRRQISDALANLVANACEAMPERGKLHLGARREGETIRLSVTDSGSGIAREDLLRLFEPLFTTKTRGIGLGLAIARRYVEANGGRIEAESREGRGSVFTVILPLVEPTRE